MSRLDRARTLMARPEAWLEPPGAGADDQAARWRLRLTPDRRGRVALELDGAAIAALRLDPGLVETPGAVRARRAGGEAPLPGRPGVIEGVRTVVDADGALAERPANLATSPLRWLAGRRDADGRPFLTPVEVAAGERLRDDAEAAHAGPSMTQRWDAGPRGQGGSAARFEPGERRLAAAGRVRRALAACDPRARAVVERICILESALSLAERDLGLRRREGRRLLQAGLAALAAHYRLG